MVRIEAAVLEGLTEEQARDQRRAERARWRAVYANGLIATGEPWEWFERLCAQQAHVLEQEVLNADVLLDEREADRKIGSAAVWRAMPSKIRAYRDDFNKAVVNANRKQSQQEETQQ